MTEKEFISNKIPILIKEGYKKPQAYMIAKSMFEKEGYKAQSGGMFNQPVPQSIGYTAPNLNTLPTQGYDFSYTNNFNPQPVENNTSFGQNQFSNSAYSVPDELGYNFDPQKSFVNYNQTQNTQEVSNKQNPYTQNSVNIMNPFGGISMDYALNFAGEGFGSGNYGQATLGTGTALLKGTRNFLSGYSTGKENKRVQGEYMDKMFDRTPNYAYGQQGGVKNSDIIAQNAITDQGQGNVNLEGSEFVMRTNGQVQPVIGDKHIENGKKADGVDAQLNDGDKVLSNYVKLKPTDIKELKERYDISLKRGVTFAEAQKKLDQKLGIKKLETEKADILEKIEKATKIKDTDSKQLSLEVLTKKTGEVNEKLNTLSGVRADNFEFLFQRQETIPKKGSGNELFDKNGKEVTETNEEVAQQGGKFTEQEKKIIQELVQKENIFGSFGDGINSESGRGFEYGKAADYLAKPLYGVNYNRNEQILEEARRVVLENRAKRNNEIKSLKSSDSYIDNVKGYAKDLLGFQQGGKIETLAKKYGISIERAQELMSFQQGGVQNEQEEVEEGQASNEQEEQDEISIEQVISAFAELSQQDPQQIIAQLQEMSPEEQQQALGQMMQALQQGQQNPIEEQEEDMEEQGEENEQEEDMEVAQQGVRYSEKDRESRLSDFYNMTAGLGYEGKKEIGAMQNWMADNYPDEVVKYFTEAGQPLTAKHVDIVKSKYKDVFKETGISANKKSEDYTTEEKSKLQTALGEKANKEFLLEGFKDNKWDWRFPMVTQKPVTSIQGAPQTQITAPSMARFYSPEEQSPVVQVTPQAEVAPEQKQEAPASGVRNIMPNFGTYIPLFSPMQPLAKETIEIPRMDAIEKSAEEALKVNASNYATTLDRLEQSGMSPQQIAATMGSALASTQEADTRAISQVSDFNAQNQFQADNYNLGAQAKEDIMNAQFRQNYQDKAMQTLANNEESIRNQYRSSFLQGEKDRQYIDQVNKANMMSDQWALVPGQGIVALNNKPAELPKMYIPKAVYDKMTAEEVNAIKKKAGATGMQLQIS